MHPWQEQEHRSAKTLSNPPSIYKLYWCFPSNKSSLFIIESVAGLRGVSLKWQDCNSPPLHPIYPFSYCQNKIRKLTQTPQIWSYIPKGDHMNWAQLLKGRWGKESHRLFHEMLPATSAKPDTEVLWNGPSQQCFKLKAKNDLWFNSNPKRNSTTAADGYCTASWAHSQLALCHLKVSSIGIYHHSDCGGGSTRTACRI